MAESIEHRYGMTLRLLLLEPLDNLRLLGRRAVLAFMGIAVGSAAVVALLNIGHSAQTEAMSVFRGMGSDLLVASVQLPVGNHLTQAAGEVGMDLASLRKVPSGVQSAAALTPANIEVRFQGRSLSFTIVGSSPGLPAVLGLATVLGRVLNDFDDRSTYAVLGSNVVTRLAAEGIPVSLGSRLQVGGYLFEVVGILQPHSRNPLLPVFVDDSILVPISSMRRIIPFPQVSSVVARINSSGSLTEMRPRFMAWLVEQMPGFEVNVQIPQQLLDGIARQSHLFSLLLAGLGGVSLLVGGIGVMNVMVMTVAERRREIGVRMALGARPSDIARLFLLEAMMLATTGAIAGALVGQAAAWLFVRLTGWSVFAMSPIAIPLGIGSAITTGLFFGLAPALSAAKLQPVYALRDA